MNGIRTPENLRVMMVLGGLPNDWDQIASTMLHTIEANKLTLAQVMPKLQQEWDRRSVRSGGNQQQAFVARSNIKRAGKKPEWQNQGPNNQFRPQNNYNNQGQNFAQGQNRPNQKPFQNRQLRDRIAPYNPNQQRFQPKQQQQPQSQNRGPKFERNRINRENKKKARLLYAGMQEGSSGMNQNEKANIPQFANMAISIKQEPMEIDLSEENFPPIPTMPKEGLHWDEYATLDYDNADDDYEIMTCHDEMHMNPMGSRRYESPPPKSLADRISEQPLTKSEIDRLTDDSDKENDKAKEKEKTKKFLKDWYGDDNSDAVSFGGDYNDDLDCDLDYEWFVSKSLTHINADRHDIVLTADLDFIHSNICKKCNSLKLNVALSLSQMSLERTKNTGC